MDTSKARWFWGKPGEKVLRRMQNSETLGKVEHLGTLTYRWSTVNGQHGLCASSYAAQRAVRRALRETNDV